MKDDAIRNLEFLSCVNPRSADKIRREISLLVKEEKEYRDKIKRISMFHKFFFYKTSMGHKSNFAISQRNLPKPAPRENPIEVPEDLSEYFLKRIDLLYGEKIITPEENFEEVAKKKLPFGISENDAMILSNAKIVLLSRNDGGTHAKDFISLFASGSKLIDSGKSRHGEKFATLANKGDVDFGIVDLRRVNHPEYYKQKKSLKKIGEKIIVISPSESLRDALRKIIEILQ